VEPTPHDRPAILPEPAAVPPTPEPPAAPVPVKRDVGVYGSSQGW
ncbi:MAG: hypothetical protein H0T79_03995, partial [Deltaproteobacteria bacterium]|nr:hypothetical protein [Deltaproteobacteria bacterium]